ncbi:uncharacterized protein EDB93DRAFT_1102432 [Suillus bovinus]|uniref:uncharacterized protein n=1 Tax=Suillus bovinus TaxID=48563 RepID=UPI001B85B438|nr:uncharacterized protein EDB93DRAFT_1102432 [Suillus bovinus]KAG2154302.1 hypothetical protein EDB93DRAFT_1102432 [Suillus bovinus]
MTFSCIGQVSWYFRRTLERHNEEKEEKLLKRCPPDHEETRFMDIPATILDVSSTIITWYLPDALTATTQKEIWAATDLLSLSLEKTWFQQGHKNLLDPEVSASLKGPLSEGILNVIARPAAIASGSCIWSSTGQGDEHFKPRRKGRKQGTAKNVQDPPVLGIRI